MFLLEVVQRSPIIHACIVILKFFDLQHFVSLLTFAMLMWYSSSIVILLLLGFLLFFEYFKYLFLYQMFSKFKSINQPLPYILIDSEIILMLFGVYNFSKVQNVVKYLLTLFCVGFSLFDFLIQVNLHVFQFKWTILDCSFRLIFTFLFFLLFSHFIEVCEHFLLQLLGLFFPVNDNNIFFLNLFILLLSYEISFVTLRLETFKHFLLSVFSVYFFLLFLLVYHHFVTSI